MKKAVVFSFLSLFILGVIGFTPVHVDAAVRVSGYTTKKGTYVAPSYRSSSNSVKYDNYSSKGNYNPYTGKKGTKNW
jgi:hypothetical protein